MATASFVRNTVQLAEELGGRLRTWNHGYAEMMFATADDTERCIENGKEGGVRAFSAHYWLPIAPRV